MGRWDTFVAPELSDIIYRLRVLSSTTWSTTACLLTLQLLTSTLKKLLVCTMMWVKDKYKFYLTWLDEMWPKGRVTVQEWFKRINLWSNMWYYMFLNILLDHDTTKYFLSTKVLIYIHIRTGGARSTPNTSVVYYNTSIYY